MADSFPAVCHYDSHTLLTRDGELIQTIEITGEKIDTSEFDSVLRNDIRKAILATVKDYKIAIYFHTVRGRKNVMPESKFSNDFAKKLNDDWCVKNNFDKQLINTIYITLVYQGSSHSVFNVYNLFKSLIFPVIKKEQLAYLAASHQKLEKVIIETLAKLHSHGARRLDLIETSEGVISEQLTFYYHLLNMDRRKVMLSRSDCSTELTGQQFKFNFNSIEIKSSYNNKYAAIFSLKDYYELSPETLDQLLQLGFEYILTQVVLFVPSKQAQKDYQDMADIAVLSKNKTINELNGLKKFMQADKGDCSYCRQQVTITIFSDNEKFFQSKINQAIKEFNNLGLATIREDFNMAALFLGQLPGNFRFLKNARFTYLDTQRIGAYCTIFDNEVGNYYGSKWGAPITLLRTSAGTPFYFNFHNKADHGHTLIVGPMDSGKTVMSRFLIAQSLKSSPRVIYIDFEGNSKKFIESIGGCHMSCDDIIQNFKLNPFKLASFKNDPNLFKDWLIDCIYPKAKTIPSYSEIFGAIAVKIFENIDSLSKANSILTLIDQFNDNAVKQSAKDFFETKNLFGKYFTENNNQFDLFGMAKDNIIGLDLSDLANDPQLFKAYVGVLLENILIVIKQNPNNDRTLIYINKFDSLFGITHFKKVLSEWLRVLDSKNGLLLANGLHKESFEKDVDYQEVIEMMATKMFLSDKVADKYFKRCYQLSDDELHKVKSYSSNRRTFLLKQDKISKVLSLNLHGMEEDLIVLDA